MKRGSTTERWREVLREIPQHLGEDLWTAAADPLPRLPRTPGSDLRPAASVPLVLAAVVVLIFNTNMYDFGYGLGLFSGLLLAGIQSVALVGALQRPILAWWASTGVMVVSTLLAGAGNLGGMGGNAGAAFMTPWGAGGLVVQTAILFMTALQARPRIAVEVLTISVLAAQLVARFGPGPDNESWPAVSIMAIAVLVGGSLRGRRVARSQLVVQEELTAEERNRRTLLEERSRIARELHDVVAHHMSIISIQAQVAPHLVQDPSPELLENLAGIRQNALEALTELRRVLGVLRSEDALAESMRHAPQPTLERLDELVSNVRGAGLSVTVETLGTPRPLPPGIELSAFRIVQEGLSNVIRHAPGASARVEIGYHPAGVTVRVANTAPDRAAPPSAGAGHGLLGMRERTAMLGGELAAGPTPDGGHEVVATLPAPPSPAAAPLPEPAHPAEDTP